MSDAYEEIRRRAVVMVEEKGIDAATDRAGVRAVVGGAVDDYQRRAHLGRSRALADPSGMVERVMRSVADFGPLTDLLTRPDLEEVFIEGSRVTYIDGGGRLRALDQPTSERENRQVLDRLLADSDRRLDASCPLVQARVLEDSARLTAVIPPVADRLSATIRRYALRRETLDTMVERSSVSSSAARFLWAVMQASTSLVVSGPPGAGKTSLLSALIAAVPAAHCVRCCEEVRELHVPLVHGSFYEARPAALDGSGEINLRELVKLVLAMRPDRIIVGEVRGAESFELTRAVNAGCGFACTVHANSAADALDALVNAALMAGENITEAVVKKVFASALDFVVHLDRDTAGDGPIRRQVIEILAVVPSLREDFSTQPIFVRERLGAPMEWTGALPPAAVVDRIDRSLPDGSRLRSILGAREGVA
ncbi:MAG TPA: ATPase, T2SS/T4P/T4SS family [Acidimicrobiia bacterium]|nr:ATPase, T2SS/T4P/T4SS family [Acidimicrobiia bacterium]